MIVGDNTAVKALAALYAATPLDTLKKWQRFKVADQASPYLSKRFVDSRFDFTKTLTRRQGAPPALAARHRRGRRPARRGARRDLCRALFPGVVQGADGRAGRQPEDGDGRRASRPTAGWSRRPSRRRSTKLAAHGRDGRLSGQVPRLFEAGDEGRTTFTATSSAARAFEWDYQLSDLGKPVDRKKWAMSPATVNAYNGGLENKIVFPAGILQPPFFDPTADAAVNYGAIGAIIGHEIMHGFDDQGRKIDATGAVRDWWTAERCEAVRSACRSFGKQYASYEAAPGVFINGELTMGENIGDMSGLRSPTRPTRSFARRQAGAGDRRPDRRPALLPRLRPGVARQAARGCDQDAGRVRPAQPAPLSGDRPAPQPRRLVRGVRDRAGFEILHPAGEARPDLVIDRRRNASDPLREVRGWASSAAHFFIRLRVSSSDRAAS